MNRRLHVIAMLAAAAAILPALSARAANTWDGGGGADNNWGTAANWDNNQVPTFPMALTFPGVASPTANNNLSNITVNGIAFTGSTSWTLNGNAITLAGNISNSVSTNSLQTINLPMALSNSISVNSVGTVAVTQPITGTGSISVTKGVLSLGADNSFSGDTIVYGGNTGVGALAYTADQTGVHTLIIQMNQGDSFGSQVIADFTAANVTATGLVVKNQAFNNIFSLAAGKTLTINGPVDIGAVDPGNSSSVSSGLQIHGLTGGSLVINSGSGNLTIGGNSSGTGMSTGILNFTNPTAAFTFTGNEVRIGGGQATTTGNNSSGTLTLGSEANSITANAITVGGGSTLALSPIGGTMNLGSSTNAINADNIYIGTQGSNGAVAFATGNGSVTIRDKAGTGRAAIVVGDGTGVSTGLGAPTATLNLGNGTADILASTLYIATRKTGTVTYSHGTIDATSIQMATAAGNGTLNVLGTANLIVNSASGPGGGSFSMANAQVAFAQAVGNFNISGGSALVNTNIVVTNGQIGATAIGAIKLAGGTLDMMNHSIGAAGNGIGNIFLNAQKGTLKNLSQLNGGGTLTKSGASTDVLVLDGANTYTGATSVSAGTLLVNGTHSGGGLYTVASGATLGGTGSTSSPVTVNSGGYLSPGASIESLDVGGTTLNGTLEIELNDADTNLVDLLNVNGALDISGTSAADFSVIGTPSAPEYVFAKYASLTGTQFANISDLPNGYTIDYHFNDGETSNNIALVAVPEPSAAVLGVLGLAGILLAAMQQRQRN